MLTNSVKVMSNLLLSEIILQALCDDPSASFEYPRPLGLTYVWGIFLNPLNSMKIATMAYVQVHYGY